MTEFILEKYKIQSTGADGGHDYIMSEVEHQGKTRKLVVLFACKSDEKSLKENLLIRVRGLIQDDGEKYDLIMNNATIE
ncbi:hypothetical protein [Winogradskyella sp. A3E31]|uniref:hypothetical protein n=1 Tax=Winogradskyella sp. A3E31 TaxID=3349637 RepID=UPI00398AC235